MINPPAYPTYPTSTWGYPAPRAYAAPSFPSPLQGIRAKEPEILAALSVLAQTQNLPRDEAQLQGMGINIIFHSGLEALAVIRQLNASVEFGDTGDPSAHAVWVKEQNKMVINQSYRGNLSPPVLNAIAASIYHEAGHAARLGDHLSSIQEELDCLALNTMAYRTHAAKDPRYVGASSQGPLRALFENGVALYPKLFFDPDPTKRALVNRVIEKYGMLPPESPDHRIPTLLYGKSVTERVLYELHRRNTAQSA